MKINIDVHKQLGELDKKIMTAMELAKELNFSHSELIELLISIVFEQQKLNYMLYREVDRLKDNVSK